jgi:hypothetical protein
MYRFNWAKAKCKGAVVRLSNPYLFQNRLVACNVDIKFTEFAKVQENGENLVVFGGFGTGAQTYA